MKPYEYLVIVGSSGAGKTTLVNGLRTPEYADSLVIPVRHITRPPRQGDDITENHHVSHSKFQDGVDSGLIWPSWSRILDGSRVERYGFDTVTAKGLVIYSANNAFLRNRNPSVQAVLEHALVVHVMASQTERTGRFTERSPDVAAAEREIRLGDNAEDIAQAHTDTEVIDTTGLSDVEGQLVLRGIVDQVLAANKLSE